MSPSTASTPAVDKKIVEFAQQLADCAGEMIRGAVQDEKRSIRPLDKDDGSPVTALDREVELRLRESIRKRYPGHGIIGEEFGADNPAAEHVWVLDPIDGTKAFLAQVPVYGTLIALALDRHPILGVVDHPLLPERWIGIDGAGTWCNDDIMSLMMLAATKGTRLELVACGSDAADAAAAIAALVANRFDETE
eukprot:XP_019860714.1 PREDICTED: bifunctional phosphatase IMPL2, chloroplastic-like [Amphimedon queenslandica]